LSDEFPKHFFFAPDEVDPRWQAHREMAASIRALMERCVRTQAGKETLEQVSELVSQATALLPDGPTAKDSFADGSYFDEPLQWIDRGAMAGACNPIAPPMKIRPEGDAAVCDLTLNESYVGAPGMLHGGVIAACFDQVCGYCAISQGYMGVTAQLKIQYIKPVHLYTELRFEARVSKREERRVTVKGSCFRDGKLLASAQGIFVKIGLEQSRDMFGGG
jgi:acyl-coenzyme A thioesterase PaaI-like protein